METYKILLVVVMSGTYAEIEKNYMNEDKRAIDFELGGIISSLQEIDTYPMIGSLSTMSEANYCDDKTTSCKAYKSYCHSKYIQYYCQKTCGKCPTAKPPISEDCADSHPQCASNVKAGFCSGRRDQKAFMKTYCRKGCKYCRSPAKPKNTKACGVATIRNRKNAGVKPIVGGVNSVKGFFPWQVAIYYEGDFLCGGSLIDVNNILSAAHCFTGIDDDIGNFKIVLGEYNRRNEEGTEQIVMVKTIIIHEEYDSDSNQNDIAIVKLSEPATISDHIETICLPKSNEEKKDGSKCFISGWGKEYVFGEAVAILQELEVPVVSQGVCKKRNSFHGRVITPKMICTGYNDGYTFASGCHGDSGGPLSCETGGGIWKLFGIVSWGSTQCNGLDRYTVYTKVNMYLPWIKKHTS